MEYLSASRIETHDQCGLNFYFKYKDKTDDFDKTVDFHADYGKLLHEIMEQLAKRQIDVFQAKMQFQQRYQFCYVPEQYYEEWYHLGLTGIEQKAIELAYLNILGVEQEFKFSLQFGIPPLYGFVDLIYRDSKGLVIRDYKKSKPFTTTERAKKIQPYVYALAAYQLFGEIPYKFEFDFLLYGETAEYVIDDVFMELAKIKVVAGWNRIRRSQFEANHQPFYCESFCAYRSICPVYLKKNRN